MRNVGATGRAMMSSRLRHNVECTGNGTHDRHRAIVTHAASNRTATYASLAAKSATMRRPRRTLS